MAPPQLFFFQIYLIEKVSLVFNLDKTSLAKGIARFISTSLPNLPITLPRNLSY